MDVDEAIRRRRTHKFFAGGAVPEATLRDLVELARWAPNHEYTEPWRFLIVRHERLPAMQTAVLASLDSIAQAGTPEMMRKLAQKREKLIKRLAGTGAVVVVTCARSPDDPSRDREDFAASACATQNLLLAATARGLCALWSTGGVLLTEAMRSFYGARGDEHIVGVLFIGTPATELEGKRYKGVDDVIAWV